MAQSQVSIQLTAKDNASGVFKSHAEALRQAQQGYESLGQYMRRTSTEAQNAQKAQQQAGEAARNAGDAAESASGGWRSLLPAFTLGTLAANAIQGAIGAATNAIKQSITAAQTYERSLLGVNSTGAAFGYTAQQINSALKTVTTDGMLSFTSAATTLKNLLSTGMDIDTAVTLMQRFKDEAAFGRAETLSFDQAVQNLGQAYKTQSSELGDLAGHTDNFSNAIEIGAAALGKQTSALTDAEREQAKLIGYMQQGAHTAGNAAQMADSSAGATARQAAEAEKASVMLGRALVPAFQFATESSTSFLQGINSSGEGVAIFQGTLVGVMAILQGLAQVFVGTFHAIVGAAKTLFTLDFQHLNNGINRATDGFVDIWNNYTNQMDGILAGSNDDQLQGMEQLQRDMNATSGAGTDTRGKQEADATRQFQRQMEQRRQSFEESLRDMVIAHRDKTRAIEADIKREQAAYELAAAQRKDDMDEDLVLMEERKAEKIADIREQMAEEERKGVLDNGRFYSTASKDRLTKLQKSIDDEQRKHQQAIQKRRAQYAEDLSEDRARHDEKITQLQQSLREQLTIMERHRGDVARVGEAQKEDDITRLKRQFAEQNAEAIRNHQENLVRIREQGTSQGGAFNRALATGIAQTKEEPKRQVELSIRDAVNSGGLQIEAGGQKAAKTFWDWFNKGMSDGVVGARSKVQLNLQQAFSSGGLGISGNLSISGLSFAHKATGGITRHGETTLVGERGPEIAQFPPGTRIYPAEQSRQILNQPSSGSTINYSVGTQIIQSPTDFRSELQWLALRTS